MAPILEGHMAGRLQKELLRQGQPVPILRDPIVEHQKGSLAMGSRQTQKLLAPKSLQMALQGRRLGLQRSMLARMRIEDCVW